jgi:hypothetical protein
MIGKHKSTVVATLLTGALLAWASGPATADPLRGRVLDGHFMVRGPGRLDTTGSGANRCRWQFRA